MIKTTAKIQTLREYAASTVKKNYEDDTTCWKPTRDAQGKHASIIRFLPATKSETFPFVSYFTHGFQGPSGKWMIFNCPSSIHTTGYPSDHCPVCAHVHSLYQGGEAEKTAAKAFQRKKYWSANIVVVSDPAVPANAGGVFKFQFGSTVFAKITDCLEEAEPLDPFCLVSGANFALNIQKIGGYPNYDKSKFLKVSRFCEDSAIDALLAKAHPLQPLVDPSQFKSYEELERRFTSVMGETAPAPAPVAVAPVATAPKATATPAPARKPATSEQAPLDEDDAFFQNLAARS